MRIKWHCRLLRLASLPNCLCFVTAREEEEFYRARRRVTREAGAAWSRTSPRLSSRRSRGFSGRRLASARRPSPRHCGSSRGPRLSFAPLAVGALEDE